MKILSQEEIKCVSGGNVTFTPNVDGSFMIEISYTSDHLAFAGFDFYSDSILCNGQQIESMTTCNGYYVNYQATPDYDICLMRINLIP